MKINSIFEISKFKTSNFQKLIQLNKLSHTVDSNYFFLAIPRCRYRSRSDKFLF